MKIKHLLLILFLLLNSTFYGVCQGSIFNVLKNDTNLADEYFAKNNFTTALHFYKSASKKSGPSESLSLQIARCYYILKKYDLAVKEYEKLIRRENNLPDSDLFKLAEAYAGTANYKKAIDYYKKYLLKHPGDDLILKKIWRLNNIRFLYEDSLHYELRPISLNTGYGELCPISFRGGIVFMSNREEVQLVQYINASLNTPYYRLYKSNSFRDSLVGSRQVYYEEPIVFCNELPFKYHIGPVKFYNKSKNMVFAASGGENGKGKGRTLQLYFAEEFEGKWNLTGSFPYNSFKYSISDPAISEDGKFLIFSSDMEGGYGGKDLYSSQFVNGEWTRPKNLGETINTAYEEVYPYLHLGKILYFSSNGHAGMGGLDIFKAEIDNHTFKEVQNLGYPLNSFSDDFGIVIDSLSTHGYLTSNRDKGGFDDDIYEFDMDIQTYPLQVDGFIKYIEHHWVDSSELKLLPNAKLYLIDIIRNVAVGEGRSDANGNFKLEVPYFSKYKIRVTADNIEEGIVSFEVPKYRKLNNKYEIVVVKDDFESYDYLDER